VKPDWPRVALVVLLVWTAFIIGLVVATWWN
jgi:hypothetical protein